MSEAGFSGGLAGCSAGAGGLSWATIRWLKSSTKEAAFSGLTKRLAR